MTEFAFSHETGTVFVGTAAINEAIDSAQYDISQFTPLESLLTGNKSELPPTHDPQTQGPVRSDHYKWVQTWQRNDYKTYARWVNRILQKLPEEEQPAQPRNSDYITLARIGLGPTGKSIRNRFGTLGALHKQAGITKRSYVGEFDDWTMQDFIQFGKNASRQYFNDGPVKYYGLNSISSGSEEPTPSGLIVTKRFGSLANFNEHLGFVDCSGWSEEEYVEWGSRVIEANGFIPSKNDVSFLSTHHFGPSDRQLYNIFGSLRKFQARAEELYNEKQRELTRHIDKQVATLREQVECGDLPVEMLNMIDEHDFLCRIAKAQLLTTTGASHQTILSKISAPVDKIVQLVQNNSALNSVARIEVWAEQHEIFDDLWPMDDYKQKLKLPSKLIGHRKFVSTSHRPVDNQDAYTPSNWDSKQSPKNTSIVDSD